MKKLAVLTTLLFFTSAWAENVNYNVFVKLDNTAESQVREISDELAKVGVKSLYSQGYQVHLTLYLTEYDKSKFNNIKKVVQKFAREKRPFDVSFYGMHKTAGKWFMLDNRMTPELQQLSDEMTVQLTKLRATDAKLPDWVKNYPEKVKSFEKYGSPNVFANFDPHVTLLTPNEFNKGVAKFEENYTFKPFTAKVIGIGIAQVDDLGQAKDVLYFQKFK
ncbi:2'-5' RNA ligase family protein [Kingella negevensis]|uniref:2',5' RNA ligase family n=1 Tax=Kingella negevensis TaxID=1522312 RepID=A0A238TCM9_9NEIS|nr:2'-5' RNA ligase family protein [Kingella negevensis]MDK4680909.1 2'-5' RNA ligase family protein [Kingella negevensis]MDK4683111.1 2'-5' RNA ligase family protein [Kingella negevensis]MDK4684006.1 2'-5' RNA ligase family protein [Kingella negevensis]MDK4687967.1 2'-5' RNA ligase family protein [Kingella negevensis]MDK4691756.1 2'-5' RNA ligase family protein [Kingella negevensis]